MHMPRLYVGIDACLLYRLLEVPPNEVKKAVVWQPNHELKANSKQDCPLSR